MTSSRQKKIFIEKKVAPVLQIVLAIQSAKPLLRASDADKVDAFASLTSLLQDPELNGHKDVQDAIKQLTSLLNTGLAVIEEKELE
ncbi:Hypothetical predicted protein, partial [Paramuricea clavata]